MTHQQMVDLVNKENPISLKYNESLINRIHTKYPIINKIEISIIVKSIFQSIREFLILGKVLNFNSLFFDTKLLIFSYTRNGATFPSVKIKISTPPPIAKS